MDWLVRLILGIFALATLVIVLVIITPFALVLLFGYAVFTGISLIIDLSDEFFIRKRVGRHKE